MRFPCFLAQFCSFARLNLRYYLGVGSGIAQMRPPEQNGAEWPK